MHLFHHKGLTLSLLTLMLLLGVLFCVPTLHQDLTYHTFADNRPLWGLPNFANVISNLALILVGGLGISFVHRPHPQFRYREERWLYLFFFGGVLLSGVGSAYYHLEPNNMSLVWDRLPITMTFMAFLAAMISERIGHRIGQWLIGPLIAFGMGSVFYWYSIDDLRLYGFVLFFPYVLIPLLFWLYPAPYTKSALLLHGMLWSLLSRIFEYFDQDIYQLTRHIISGHTLKHLAMAFAAFLVLQYLIQRQSTPTRQPQKP